MGRAVQAQPYDGAAVSGVVGLDCAAVRLGYLAHDREAEPRAGHRARGGRAVEAVEDERPVLVGDTRARGRARAARRRASETSTDEPSPLHLPAFSSRFQTARSIRSRIAVDDGRLEAVGRPR